MNISWHKQWHSRCLGVSFFSPGCSSGGEWIKQICTQSAVLNGNNKVHRCGKRKREKKRESNNSKEKGGGNLKKNIREKNTSVPCEQSQNVEIGQCQIRYENRYANVGRAKGDYAPTSISQLCAIEDNFSLSIGRDHAQQSACASQ